MAILIAVPILSALLVFQTSILSRIPLIQGTADLVMLAVIAWALQRRVETAWHWGIIGGLMVSYVSAVPFGVPLIGYLLAVGLALALRRRVWQIPILAMFITTFCASLVAQFTTLVALRLFGTTLPLLQALNLVIIPSLLLNLLLALPFYTLLADLARWIYPLSLEM